MTTPPEPSMLLALGQRIEIHGEVALVGLEHRAGRSAGNHGFQLLAAPHAAADFVDHAHQVEAHRQLVNAGLVDVPGEAEQARAAVFRRAERREGRAAVADDRRNRAQTSRRCSGSVGD